MGIEQAILAGTRGFSCCLAYPSRAPRNLWNTPGWVFFTHPLTARVSAQPLIESSKEVLLLRHRLVIRKHWRCLAPCSACKVASWTQPAPDIVLDTLLRAFADSGRVAGVARRGEGVNAHYEAFSDALGEIGAQVIGWTLSEGHRDTARRWNRSNAGTSYIAATEKRPAVRRAFR